MLKNSQDFSMEEVKHMAESPDIQQLLTMLQQSDPQKLKQAAELAGNGDLSAAMKTMQDLLSSDQARQLLDQLRR